MFKHLLFFAGFVAALFIIPAYARSLTAQDAAQPVPAVIGVRVDAM